MTNIKTNKRDMNKENDSAIKSLKSDNDTVFALFKESARLINAGDYPAARDTLRKIFVKDMENPEAYNLLGICYEIAGDREKAARFYRVAYYMDQTFKAAYDNLERVCNIWYKGSSAINWGLECRGEKA